MIQNQKLGSLLLCSIFLLAGCAFDQRPAQQPFQPALSPSNQLFLPEMPSSQLRESIIDTPSMPLSAAPMTGAERQRYQNMNKLDFEVENQTGKTIFVACFSYIKRRAFTRWRWDKSDIYVLEQGQRTVISIDDVQDPRDRKNVFGYLALFDTHKAADEAVYELLPDNIQIDLDQLEKLKGKKVVIEVEKYGAKGAFYEYDFVKKKQAARLAADQIDSLDFAIENKTGKPIYVVCFTYQKKAKGEWIGALGGKDDMALWHYTKEPILHLMPDETELMHVQHVTKGRDQVYVQGFLAVFSENEEQLANDITYEQLTSKRRLALGRLFQLDGQKVVLEVEKYGIANDFIDYRIKPTQSIDFTKIRGPRKDFLKETQHHETIHASDDTLPA